MTQQTDFNYDSWSDWNYVKAIQFSFGKLIVGADKNNAARNLLNAAYSQKLTNINSILTIDNNVAETLKPDAISKIKSLVIAAIITAAIIENLPLSEVSYITQPPLLRFYPPPPTPVLPLNIRRSVATPPPIILWLLLRTTFDSLRLFLCPADAIFFHFRTSFFPSCL
eukprot:jgi/Psemu1/67651/estExt_Genemark1.C_3520021